VTKIRLCGSPSFSLLLNKIFDLPTFADHHLTPSINRSSPIRAYYGTPELMIQLDCRLRGHVLFWEVKIHGNLETLPQACSHLS
jgi:hypothetical protein